MGIAGKLSAQIRVKCGGDVFHQLYKHKPHEVSKICSNLVQGCDLHQGSWGEVGAVICWNYMIGKSEIYMIDDHIMFFKIFRSIYTLNNFHFP